MESTFYDRSGRAVAYTEDGTRIFLFSGHAAAFIHKNSVYDYSGRHLGWFLNGWVREHSGSCVLFTGKARGGPKKPAKGILPSKVAKMGVPPMGEQQPVPPRPEFRKTWSAVGGEQFFEWYASNKMGTVPMSWSELRTPKDK